MLHQTSQKSALLTQFTLKGPQGWSVSDKVKWHNSDASTSWTLSARDWNASALLAILVEKGSIPFVFLLWVK